MLTKMNIALAAALIVATSSAALAENAKPNFVNRSAGYGDWLRSRDVSLPTRQTGSQDWFDVERSDRASSPFAGGGGL
jgi:hypothetical protein